MLLATARIIRLASLAAASQYYFQSSSLLAAERESRSDPQRGSRSGGRASTLNVFSHLGQGGVENSFDQHNLAVVAPRDFFGVDPNHSRSAGSRRSGSGSRDSDSRRSFASAGAQAIGGGGSPHSSSRRCGSWGGGILSSVGAALAWGTPAGNNQVTTSDSFYRRNRGEGQFSKQESRNAVWTAGLSDGRSIPGPASPMQATRGVEPSDGYKPGGHQRSAYDQTAVPGSISYPQQPSPTTKLPISHGGLTSSSAYGSSRDQDSNPSPENGDMPASHSRVASYNTDLHRHQEFGGFGGKFGERSLMNDRSGANRGKARLGGGILPGYAPSSGGGVDAALSANMFACGHNQNCGNFITERPTSRVTAPPGGHSTFRLG